MSQSQTEIYRFPISSPKSSQYTLRINGETCAVLEDIVEDFACFGFSGSAEVEITFPIPVEDLQILPLRLRPPVQVDGRTVRIQLDQPEDFCVEVRGAKRLFLFSNPLQTPVEEGMQTTVYKAGQIYEIGQVNLQSGDHVHIEGGAIVKGAFNVHHADDVQITGFGVLDNSYFPAGGKSTYTINPFRSRGLRISGITMVRPSRWTLAMWECDDVIIDGIRQITTGNGSDGIDIVSSADVTVRNCFLRNGDDCVVIKSTHFDPTQGGQNHHNRANRDVRNVLVEGCRFFNAGGGSAVEIGHELRCEVVENITFRDCDILATHGHGAALCINAGESATVRDVLYEDIRIDHYYEKLISFRIMKSRYSYEAERGQIRDITLRNVAVHDSIMNPGYSVSIIGGYDDEHTVDRVHFDNFTRNGEKVLSLGDFDCYTRAAHNITFK